MPVDRQPQIQIPRASAQALRPVALGAPALEAQASKSQSRWTQLRGNLLSLKDFYKVFVRLKRAAAATYPGFVADMSRGNGPQTWIRTSIAWERGRNMVANGGAKWGMT